MTEINGRVHEGLWTSIDAALASSFFPVFTAFLSPLLPSASHVLVAWFVGIDHNHTSFGKALLCSSSKAPLL